MEQTELGAKLALSPLLAGMEIPPEQLSVQQYRAGQIVSDCYKGTPSVGLVTVGRLEVYSVALDGKDVLLNELTAGECFGICNLLAPSELETVLRCGTESEILYIPKSVLRQCLTKDSTFALRFGTVCGKKLQFLLRRIELLTMQSCRGRVIAFLLSRQDQNGTVHLHGSREDLARHLGVSRAALFRELAALQAMGTVAAHESGLSVLDSQQLEHLLYHPSNTK